VGDLRKKLGTSSQLRGQESTGVLRALSDRTTTERQNDGSTLRTHWHWPHRSGGGAHSQPSIPFPIRGRGPDRAVPSRAHCAARRGAKSHPITRLSSRPGAASSKTDRAPKYTTLQTTSLYSVHSSCPLSQMRTHLKIHS